METKYYKWGQIYYKVSAERLEKVYAYSHCFGIEISNQTLDDTDAIEITETQYSRVRKLILKKLQNV